ncbi:MAG: mechanosensitive ion channel family protein [Flavobacteriales bacterium]|nr:mechanosensitive ion channel family protein [Flavobacteriales bacterium]
MPGFSDKFTALPKPDRELPVLHEFFHEGLPQWLNHMGMSTGHNDRVGAFAGAVVATVVLLAMARVLTWGFQVVLRRISSKTGTHFDDHLLTQRLHHYLGRIIPLIIGFRSLPAVFEDFPGWISPLEHLFVVFFIVLVVRILRAVMKAGRDTLHQREEYRGKPLDSYIQVASLVLYILGGLAIFSQLTGQSIVTFLAAMGAASAVLLLVFKDTILGFVASLQISANNMVHVGDWIAMPKYGADGDVEEINLTTVKVRNFDRTVTMVPTYALISDSFQNYRAMQEGGGRRIKRSIRIKMGSIRFLAPEELERLKAIELLGTYIHEKQAEIEAFNREHQVDKGLLLNGRNQTNVGLFRQYMGRYLVQQPGIRTDMTATVRQLQPDEFGLPLEVYCFSSDVGFEGMERIQADLFDHLIAAAPTFGLEIFEKPASDDLRAIANNFSLRQA